MSLLEFLTEVVHLVLGEIAIHDMVTLALTNKAVKAYMEPHLYHKVYTRCETPQDTAGLVKLLRCRPDVIPHQHPRFGRVSPSSCARVAGDHVPQSMVSTHTR